jgi:MerR family mercuric resistance operon transcriptional regulator
MRIGAVAAAANVNEQTLRFYERQGLLDAPARAANGYREYPPETVALVRFIKRAQELGFSLDDARLLSQLRSAPAQNRVRVRALADSKLREIDRKIADLQSLRRTLRNLVADCCASDPQHCVILEALDGSSRREREPHNNKDGEE